MAVLRNRTARSEAESTSKRTNTNTEELPAAVKADLLAHLERVRRQHEDDLRHGAGWVELPGALLRKYPNAGRAWA